MNSMKTFLILMNNSEYMPIYHLAVGDKLKLEGHDVIYAFTDRLPIYTYNINLEGRKFYILSDFFKDNFDTAIPSKYSDINIWKLFFSDYDRNRTHFKFPKIKGHEYTKKYISGMVNFFDYIFRENKVDVCIYECISNCFSYSCFEVAKRNGISYCGYAGSRVPGKFELYTEEYGCIERFSEAFQNLRLSEVPDTVLIEIHEYLSRYSKEDKIPTYHPAFTPMMAEYPFFKRYFSKSKYRILSGTMKYVAKNYSDIYYSYESGGPLINITSLFIRQFKRKWRIFAGNSLFDKPNFADKYVLYPLHLKPEASTSVLAMNYCDDISVLKNIAFSLPQGWYLYIKEHFVNYGNMPLSFYKELKKIPNVRLLHCSENTKQLVGHCKALVTLTSTMGFEALMMEKPVFVFGEVFYQCHPCCIKLNGFEHLFHYLLDVESIVFGKDDNLKFIAAYYKILYDGNIYFSLYSEVNPDLFALPFINAIKMFYDIK